MAVLQPLRVIVAFSARELHTEHLQVVTFHVDDLLLALATEDGYTTFCLHDDTPELDERRQFSISDEEFDRFTEST